MMNFELQCLIDESPDDEVESILFVAICKAFHSEPFKNGDGLLTFVKDSLSRCQQSQKLGEDVKKIWSELRDDR